jgi:putative PIN family toxin of toxin-antitoxin system
VKVVFDTNTVVSALLFEHGQLSWLRDHWRSDKITALVSRPTIDELIRVLAYPKFDLSKTEIEALLANYLPYTCAITVPAQPQSPKCSDANDQMFIDLAIQVQADILLTGDRILLALDIGITIEQAADYKRRLGHYFEKS